MRSAFSSCRLYSWMRFTWQSKIVSGSTDLPGRRRGASRRTAPWPSRLACRNASRKPASSASGASRRSSARSVTQPSPMASVIARGERRVREQQPAPRRHAVGLVVEALGEQLGQVPDRRRAQQLRMDRRDAVRAVRADDREVRHPDLPLGALLDEAHALDASLVAREARPDVVEEAAVDLEDDLEVARQQHREPVERPLLERLGQQRVVGVGERPARQVPGLVPARCASSSRMRISSGHRHRGMRVVQLDRDLVGQRAPVGVAAPEAADEVGQRAGDQEVLLHEAQPLPLRRRIVRIEHAGQRLGRERLGERADEVAVAELLEVEVVAAPPPPRAGAC